MRNSLFKKYFAITSTCVLSSIIVLGAILMAVASQFYKNDKYTLLERSVTQAAEVTASTYSPPSWLNPRHTFNVNVLSLVYSSLSPSIDGEFWLTNINGELFYYSENSAERAVPDDELASYKVLPEAVNAALSGGVYRETGFFGGLYVKPQYVVGVPVTVNTGSGTEALAVLFVASPAVSMYQFMANLLEMFLLSALVVLFIAFILIYFITAGMVKPLKEMLAATNSFTKGDFTVRVPVGGYDELGQLSMAFNNMASTLAITESSRRSFVANVSHELKTPMTTIAGFIDGVLDGTVPEEKREHYLTVVSIEVKRLSRLVRSMLDTSRIEAGELEIRPVWFDISEMARQTIFSFEKSIDDKRLQIAGLEADKIMVFADTDLMNQVIYNLVENAVKFVNEGGVVSFSYRSDPRMTYVAIRNTGEGLDNEEIPKLFDRFYKSDKSRSLNKNGVGLGLHIVRSIVNYHSGEVVVRSSPGGYTEFEIALPNPKKPRDEGREKPSAAKPV